MPRPVDPLDMGLSVRRVSIITLSLDHVVKIIQSRDLSMDECPDDAFIVVRQNKLIKRSVAPDNVLDEVDVEISYTLVSTCSLNGVAKKLTPVLCLKAEPPDYVCTQMVVLVREILVLRRHWPRFRDHDWDSHGRSESSRSTGGDLSHPILRRLR